MKKKKAASFSLTFQKTNIANLQNVKGGAVGDGAPDPQSDFTTCCSVFPYCQFTLTTRPDSLEAQQKDPEND